MFFSFRNLLKNFSNVVNITTNILIIQSLKRSGANSAPGTFVEAGFESGGYSVVCPEQR
jgi:hypothetical protein